MRWCFCQLLKPSQAMEKNIFQIPWPLDKLKMFTKYALEHCGGMRNRQMRWRGGRQTSGNFQKPYLCTIYSLNHNTSSRQRPYVYVWDIKGWIRLNSVPPVWPAALCGKCLGAHVPLCDMESGTKSIIYVGTVPFVIQFPTSLGQAWTGTVLSKPRHVVTLQNTWHREEQRTSWKSSLWTFQMASPHPFLSASVTEFPTPSSLPLGSLPGPVPTRTNPPHSCS